MGYQIPVHPLTAVIRAAMLAIVAAAVGLVVPANGLCAMDRPDLMVVHPMFRHEHQHVHSTVDESADGPVFMASGAVGAGMMLVISSMLHWVPPAVLLPSVTVLILGISAALPLGPVSLVPTGPPR